MIFNWLKRHRADAAKERYRQGYDYALGALLRGEKTENELRDSIYANSVSGRDDFHSGILSALRQLRENYISRADASEIQRSADLLSAQRHWIDEGARPGTFKPALGYQESFLNTALSSGAVLTGKPDGSESITVVFSLEAWRAFGLATAKADQKS